ncbi:MAG: asparagine synthase (glutamine-hydrolyzing) [Candidatus Micrarchaeia archaeon]
MCGILGYASSVPISRASFGQALDTLSKRGPDAEGLREFKTDGCQVLFGHKRLSIIDLSAAGIQPMSDQTDDFTIIFNGEIYNFAELRAELEQKGHSFKSKSDTEVLLRGYMEYGQKVVEKLDGMFAFAVFDKKKRVLTFARDHLGKKPFFYYLDDKRFVFASEIKALLEFPVIRKALTLERMSILKFLTYGYVPSPNTIFTQIHKLEPATTFQFDLKEWKIKNKYCYWDLESIVVSDSLSEEETLDKLDLLVQKSVKKRLISDVPVGVFLSGGVDSSLISAVMAKQSKQVSSFTVAFPDYAGDESEYAKKVAEELHLNSNIIPFHKEDAKKYFFEMLDYMDEPTADPAIVPLYFIAKKAKSKITVVLSGDGGDEVFGGYSKYIAQKYAGRLKLPREMTRLMSFLARSDVHKRFLDGLDMPFYGRQFFYGSGGFHPVEAMKLMKMNAVAVDEIFKESKEYDLKFRQNDIVNRSLYLDCKLLIPDWYLTKGDRTTMAASLEMRNPFLDKELVEFAFSLAGNRKVKRNESKYLLKKLACRYVNKESIYRPKKGFAVPLDNWIFEVLKNEFKTVLFDETDGLFDMDYVQEIYSTYPRKGKNVEFKLLRIFALKYYLKRLKWFKNRG